MTAGPEGILIRRATAADLDEVVRLRLALLREYPLHPIYGRMRPDAERIARTAFRAQLDSGNEATFLACRDDRPVGILRAVEVAAAPFLVPDRYCYVSSVYVEPRRRRRGILRLLLDRASDWCRERKLGEMRLHSVGANPTASAAWDAMGFVVAEQVRIRMVGRGELTNGRTSNRTSGLTGDLTGDLASRPSGSRSSRPSEPSA